jgi:hypothetical protein
MAALYALRSAPRKITEVALYNVHVAAVYRSHHQDGCPRVTLAKAVDSIDHSYRDSGFERYKSARVSDNGLKEWISLTRTARSDCAQGRTSVEQL